jgi:hypothetical protein
MAWSKRSKPWGSERQSGEGAPWIHETSVDTAMEAVRKQWKEHGIHAKDGDWSLIQLAHIAVMRGLPRRVAPLVVRLMQQREAAGKLRWHLEEDKVGAVGISIVRLMAAYLEDPAIPVSQARAAVALFLRSIEPYDNMKPVHDLMPLIVATRLDSPYGSAAPRKNGSKLPLRTDMEATGMCVATHRQWRVEYLLAMGAEDEALELAHKGRTDKPCGETCAFAPHSMYAWLLEPLHRRGRKDEARVLHDRLETLMVPRALYLNAMGHRIHYLALEGRFEDASHLIQQMLPMAEEPDASPWQKLKFYEGCERAVELAAHEGHSELLWGTIGASDASCAYAIHEQAAALADLFRQRIW